MKMPAPARRSLVAFMVGMALLTVAGCSSSEEPERSSESSDLSGSSAERSSAPTSQTTTTAVPSVPSGTFRDVEFRALDGEMRSGRLFGERPVGVVLSHMGRPGDLRDNGAERVVGGGASIGAMASLHAAGQPASNLDGLIWLAGVLRGRYSFVESDVSGLGCPMLFMSGDRDTYGAADAARRLDECVTAPSQLLIVESERHGTDILEEGGPAATELRRSMLAFLDQVGQPGTASTARSCRR